MRVDRSRPSLLFQNLTIATISHDMIAIARITVKGSRTEKIYYVLLLAALVILFLTPYFATMSPRQGKQVALDFVLSTQSFIGLVIAIFVGSGLISKDVDKKIIYGIISKPVSRTEYILGRFAGLAFILFSAILILSSFGIVSYYFTLWMFPTLGDMPNWITYWINSFFLYIKLLIIVAISFFFSSFSTSTLFPIIVTMGVYIAGVTAVKVKNLLETAFGSNWNISFKILVNIGFYICPNLSAFDLKAQAAYGQTLPGFQLMLVAIYGLLYILITLLITIFIFKKRDLL